MIRRVGATAHHPKRNQSGRDCPPYEKNLEETMLIEVKCPQLAEGTPEGTLAAWHVKAGDAVKRDQNLCDIETDKIGARNARAGRWRSGRNQDRRWCHRHVGCGARLLIPKPRLARPLRRPLLPRPLLPRHLSLLLLRQRRARCPLRRR